MFPMSVTAAVLSVTLAVLHLPIGWLHALAYMNMAANRVLVTGGFSQG